MVVRAPHLYPRLRGFVLGAFVVLGRDLEEGAELPFAFEEHVQRAGPALYELRPLVRAFIEERRPVHARARTRFSPSRASPGAGGRDFAQAHAGPRATEDDALFRTVLLGLVVSTRSRAAVSTGTTRHSSARMRALGTLASENGAATARSRRSSASLPKAAELSESLLLRPFVTAELSTHWPETRGLLPDGFGREPDRMSVIELRTELDGGEGRPMRPPRSRTR